METGEIRLYPGNWLYNAGVIGLLKVLSSQGEENQFSLEEDGSLILKKNIFEKTHKEKIEIPKVWGYYVEFLTKDEDLENWLNKKDEKGRTNREKFKKFYDEMGEFGYKFIRAFNKLFRSNTPYQNLVQEGEWKEFIEFIANLPDFGIDRDHRKCNICGENRAVEPKIDSKLENRLFRYDLMHSSNLGPSIKLPNSFWNQNISLIVCPLCAYLIIHHHLALTKLSDSSEIFINAPSFKIMWYLNKYAQEVYSKEMLKKVREILGMSLIEMALKLNIQLGKWTMMNIEVVSKYKDKIEYKDKIDFFSLPYEVVYILSDRNISSLLNDIGELSVLNLVLDGNFRGILELGERIFKIALKPMEKRNKNEEKFISNVIKLDKNKNNLISLSQNLFKLYALIEEKIKKEVFV